jgi:hypothetical protein
MGRGCGQSKQFAEEASSLATFVVTAVVVAGSAGLGVRGFGVDEAFEFTAVEEYFAAVCAVVDGDAVAFVEGHLPRA